MNDKITLIAKYTILRLLQLGATVTPLKLQKVLYYIQAWHMVYFSKELLFNDEPEAWVNGPVYRNIYNEYKNIGVYDQITPQAIGINSEDIEKEIINLRSQMLLTDKQYEFLEAIYSHYGTMTQDRLVFLTHAEKPWNEARKGISPIEYTDQKISLDTMYDYYSKLHSKNAK